MKLRWIGAILCLGPLAAAAQGEVYVSFEEQDYRSLGVYDQWEGSPFRAGAQRLEGNVAVVNNPYPWPVPTSAGSCDTGSKVLGFQRSRFAGNVFGARVDLAEPFSTGERTKYVHVFLHRPQAGRVMLVGLGKRHSYAWQSPDVEQFWEFSLEEVPVGTWADAVFPVRTAEGVDIYSLVIVPHCESPHDLREDFAVFMDGIEVNESETPRNYLDLSGIASVSAERKWSIEVGPGRLCLVSVGGCAYVLCDASGRLLASGQCEGTKVFDLPAGVYVLNGEKVMVP